MPAFLNDRVLDLGLNVLDTEADALVLCSQQPTNFAEAATTYCLGTKTGISIGAPAARTPSGRKVTVAAIVSGAPGSVTATGTATHYGLIDTVNSRLLAAGPLGNSQSLTNGNTFTVAAFDVGFPGPD